MSDPHEEPAPGEGLGSWSPAAGSPAPGAGPASGGSPAPGGSPAAGGGPAPLDGGGSPLDEDGWRELRRRAREAMTRAYAPYSGFPVGAAALVDDGRTVTGCNVENAAYGVALCAECGLVSALFAGGGGRLTAFTCCDREGRILMPCGRCRQLLWEHGGPALQVDTARGIRPLAELLPDAFGPADLER